MKRYMTHYMTRNMSNMNNIMTRLFLVIMLMIFSMGAQADIKVLYGEKGTEKFEGTGGTIEVKQEPDEKDETKVTVFLTFIPQSGYTFDESSLKVYAVISPDVASTRAPEILGDPLKLTEEKNDVPSAKCYSVKIDSNLGLWVKKAEFENNRESGAKSNPVGTNYSGLYYIANFTGNTGTVKGYDETTPGTNYYLCPARPADDAGDGYFYDAIYYDGNEKQQPYLTTYRTGRVEEALWRVIFATTISNVDYYYIQRYSDDKYLTHNTSKAEANTRYTVHLQETTDNNNASLFCFETGTDGSFYIRTQKLSSGNRHLNPATGNKNYYYGTGANNKKTKINGTEVDPGGMIGYYTHASHSDDQASQWYLEIPKPVISQGDDKKISITHQFGEDVNIYYTTDGTEPIAGSPSILYGGSSFLPEEESSQIKAIACNKAETILSAVVTFDLAPSVAPTIHYDETNQEITISSATEGATIYYTSGAETPADPDFESGTSGVSPITISGVNSKTVIKAFAAKQGYAPSEVVTATIYYNLTVTMDPSSDIYDGSAKTVTVSVADGSTPIANTKYEVSYKKGDNIIPELIDAGTYTVVVSDVEGDNEIVSGNATFTITKAPLTVTANAKTITYGDTPANDGVTYGGFVGTDSENDLGGTLAYTYNYEQFEDVGDYSITPSGLTSDNYELSFVAGTLTVEQKEVGLEWTNTSLPYNAQGQTPTATAIGLVNNDVISVTVEGTQTEVGTDYAATAKALTGPKASNYKLPADNTTLFDITKALLTITANDKTITYGQAPDHEGVVYSGFLGDEDENTPGMFTGSLDYTYNYNQYDDVGDAYTITPSGLTSDEYDISFVAGTLTVEQKEVGITWGETTTFTYNGSEQAPTATVNAGDLVNGDAVEVTVTGAQTDVSTDPYTATASALTGDKSGNYKLSATGLTCNFTIGPKSLSSDGVIIEISKTVSGSDVSYPVTVKDGNETLNLTSDFTLDDPVTSGSYTTRDITGTNNYGGTVTAKFANVTFMSNDSDNPTDWSATFVADDDYDKPLESESITPYIVTAVGNDAVEIQALEYIPKDEPVLLLRSAASQPYGFMVRTRDNVSAPAGNLLRIAATDMTLETAEIYMLYKCEFVLNLAGTLSEGKVYLPKNINAGARLLLGNDQKTGIVNLQTDEHKNMDKWYSLDGRRLNGKPSKKGVYIMNGRKTVVK